MVFVFCWLFFVEGCVVVWVRLGVVVVRLW